MLRKRKKKPEVGDIKRSKKFLLLPRILYDKWAWLGTYILEYEYIEIELGRESPTRVWVQTKWELVDILEVDNA